MKNEKLKTNESQNSLKGKSIFENSKISDRIKSSKNSLKSKENQKPPKTKKIVIIRKSIRLEKDKTKEKSEIQKAKDEKFKKVINKAKISKTIIVIHKHFPIPFLLVFILLSHLKHIITKRNANIRTTNAHPIK